ncbi:hypothetical protein [Streptomyces mexicanus]|uniref:Uncharacterized protein n=1 Tax=Streptomyces mexicanus TaxID=178566 RepID=A0A7X1I7L9_9ACTN|nr:hypothetical protein [Streptomyces mexicanus]MBC2869826.1 hypothetical protein [Streptomyces mexicanus]
MAVTVTPQTELRIEVAWTRLDDRHGHLARAVTSGRLAHGLQALADDYGAGYTPQASAEDALAAARATTQLARLLESRAAVQVVHLRDDHKLSWRTIAEHLHGDPEKHSTVRRQYDTGRRHIEGG